MNMFDCILLFCFFPAMSSMQHLIDMVFKSRLFVLSSFLIFVLPASLYTWNSFFYDAKSTERSFLEKLDKASKQIEEYRSSSDQALQRVSNNLNNVLTNVQNKVVKLSQAMDKRHKAFTEGLSGFQLKEEMQTTKSSSTLGSSPSSGIRQNNNCIDSLEKDTGSIVELYPCHGEGRNQAWQLTSGKLIYNAALSACLSSKEGDEEVIESRPCNKADTYQLWERYDKAIKLVGSNKCLDVSEDGKTLLSKACKEGEPSQEWKI